MLLLVMGLIFHFFCSPKCRFEYKRSETPSRYYCYCGKVEDPPLDPWLVPHSCGQVCEREFKPPCGHKCLLLCHPGEFHIVCVVVFDWLFLLNVEAHRIIQAEFWFCCEKGLPLKVAMKKMIEISGKCKSKMFWWLLITSLPLLHSRSLPSLSKDGHNYLSL